METPVGNSKHWASWLAQSSIDPSVVGLDELVVTAFVHGDVAYKLVKPGVAWKFYAPFRVMDRAALAMLVRVLESDREGLVELLPYQHPALRTPPVELLFMDLHAEKSDVWVGPPPEDADFVQLNWGVNRFNFDWASVQVATQVFGPLRVRRCVQGAKVALHADEYEFADTIGISHRVMLKMMKSGADPVADRHMLGLGMDSKSAGARYARSINDMAGYEQFCPAPENWSVAEAGAWSAMLRA